MPIFSLKHARHHQPIIKPVNDSAVRQGESYCFVEHTLPASLYVLAQSFECVSLSGHMHALSQDQCLQEATAILYISEATEAGPTIIIDQTALSVLGSQGWLIQPRQNQLVVFPGNLLHGVLPGAHCWSCRQAFGQNLGCRMQEDSHLQIVFWSSKETTAEPPTRDKTKSAWLADLVLGLQHGRNGVLCLRCCTSKISSSMWLQQLCRHVLEHCTALHQSPAHCCPCMQADSSKPAAACHRQGSH